jgi:hypothetical protein
MNSVLIQERTCPRCGIRRTIRLRGSDASLCMNCHLQWDGSGPTSGPAAALPAVDPAYPFSGRELTRLQRYRAAVRHGFYSDGAADDA